MRSFYQIFTGWEELRRRLRDELGSSVAAVALWVRQRRFFLPQAARHAPAYVSGGLSHKNTKSCDGSALILARLYLSRNCPALLACTKPRHHCSRTRPALAPPTTADRPPTARRCDDGYSVLRLKWQSTNGRFL